MTKIRRTCEFNKEDIDWIEQQFPGLSYWAVVQWLIKEFRQAVEVDGNKTLLYYYKQAGSELKDKINVKEE